MPPADHREVARARAATGGAAGAAAWCAIDEAGALPLLRGLDPARVDRLLGGAAIARHAKDSLLFAAGETPQHVHMILDGSVEAFARDGGRARIVFIFAPFDIVLPAAALADEPCLLSARILKAATLLSLPAAAVRAEMAACPVFACRLVTLLAGQLRLSLRHIKDMQSRSGPQRLAAYLLRLVDEQGASGKAELPFSKGVLAARLGMTAESLSRALHILRDRGLMVRGQRASIQNRAAVEQFCRLDPLIDGGEERLGVRAW